MMPTFSASQLESLATGIFLGVGAPRDIAQHVAKSLIQSNLMGHDSHGILRIPSYLEAIDKGTCVPSAIASVAKETPTTAMVDGNWAFGQITATFATKLAIEKARTSMVAAVTTSRCNHVGRLGEYTDLAAQEGMVAIMAGGTFNSGGVTPFGGASRVLGTNPLAMSVPGNEDGPVLADIATSVVAEGKLRVARAKHVPVAPGTIVDKDGNPTTNAEDYYAGGSLLTFGGHKGYVLSVMVDLLGRALTDGMKEATNGISFGNFLVVVNVEAFRPLVEYRTEVTERLQEIKAAKPAPGVSEVLVPGEPERRTKAQRSKDGVVLAEDTVSALKQVADRFGVAMPAPQA
jgi:hydroxycarboxylate dehydrogenase B